MRRGPCARAAAASASQQPPQPRSHTSLQPLVRTRPQRIRSHQEKYLHLPGVPEVLVPHSPPAAHFRVPRSQASVAQACVAATPPSPQTLRCQSEGRPRSS
eukprot:3674573-Pleurochrysis_carterae.AAC.2